MGGGQAQPDLHCERVCWERVEIDAGPTLRYGRVWGERLDVWEVEAKPALCYGRVWAERVDVWEVDAELLYGRLWGERVEVDAETSPQFWTGV